jgi:hypothetical protein
LGEEIVNPSGKQAADVVDHSICDQGDQALGGMLDILRGVRGLT